MFCGVYDGHGAWGHFVAKRVRKLVPAFLLCNWKENVAGTSINLDFKMEADKNIHGLDLWKQSYIKTYAAVDQDLKQHTGFDSFRSGTTALTIIKQVSYLYSFSLLFSIINISQSFHFCSYDIINFQLLMQHGQFFFFFFFFIKSQHGQFHHLMS